MGPGDSWPAMSDAPGGNGVLLGGGGTDATVVADADGESTAELAPGRVCAHVTVSGFSLACNAPERQLLERRDETVTSTRFAWMSTAQNNARQMLDKS